MTDRPSFFIIDGHNLLYKAHFAMIRSPLFNSKGHPTSVPFGFVRMLQKLMGDRSPEYLAIAFDTEGPTERHERYAAYKADRAPMPAEIRLNIPIVKEIIRGYGLPILEVPGQEADDVIGSAARIMKDLGFQVFIISGDKDMLQLVSPEVRVIATKKGLSEFEVLDPEGVQAKWGVSPERLVDLLAISGDASDNIPGVKGIGPKGAARIIQDVGGALEALEQPDKVSPRYREKLIGGAEEVRLGMDLARIRVDLELPLEPDACRVEEPDRQTLRRLFTELEFRGLAEEMAGGRDQVERRYELVTRIEGLHELVRRIGAADAMGLDTETTSTDPVQASLVGISIALAPGEAWYLPVGHGVGPNLPLQEVRESLGPVLADPRLIKIGHNIKYDLTVLRRAGLAVAGPVRDSMVAAHLLEPGQRQYGLDSVSARYLNLRKIPTSSLIGKEAGVATMDLLTGEAVREYACEDADAALRLRSVLEEQLAEAGLMELYEEIECPLIPILGCMEQAGIRVDLELLEGIGVELRTRLEELETDIHTEAGEAFNIRSPKQLSRILFEKLKYPTKGIRKTSLGRSTDEASLQKLIQPGLMYRQLPEIILEHRSLAKLLSTYVEALPKMVSPATGRIHTSFNQTATETGRLSSSEPNLQNIPIRGDWGPRIRSAFIPGEEGWILLGADYSQMELRILAHLAEDEGMIEAFRQGEDIHARTAAEVFDVPLEEVTPDQRRMAKVINFGIDYGMTEYGLASRLGIPVPRAWQFIQRYMERYPGVERYIAGTVARVREDGYVQTLMGRRRFIPEIRDERRSVQQAAERRAINMPVQGSAADAIKRATIGVDRRVREGGLRARLLLQVHDELVFELPPEETEALSLILVEEMEGALELTVPLRVDIHTGANWAEAH